MEFHHISVLLHECIEGLAIKPDGIYVDGTAGGAGHSREIAKRLTTGRLFALDRDPDAVEIASDRLSAYPCAQVIHANFADLKQVLENLHLQQVDGVLLDLGVSSHQLDVAERGFSYHADAPLDMRMSQEGYSARDLVNTCEETELARILFEYGEEKFSRRIAAAIVKERQQHPIETTGQLSEIIRNAVPAKSRREKNPSRRSFQAIRIAVNSELDNLSKALDDVFDCLKPGGRFAVITFHSLEDRMVKQKFKSMAQGCTCPPEFPVCVCGNKPKIKLITRKPIEAGEEELAANPRSRSAKLRVAEKL
ncbi:MAG TPA: 16S rRNA (cytosine(1402)-N(4))-methyltransferase RsmH [Firmicutes bacterium]|nr:16S rRNA (cytosine(1402)-N(4))-methyltransferase RsmH [Bacillota bacterium]